MAEVLHGPVRTSSNDSRRRPAPYIPRHSTSRNQSIDEDRSIGDLLDDPMSLVDSCIHPSKDDFRISPLPMQRSGVSDLASVLSFADPGLASGLPLMNSHTNASVLEENRPVAGGCQSNTCSASESASTQPHPPQLPSATRTSSQSSAHSETSSLSATTSTSSWTACASAAASAMSAQTHSKAEAVVLAALDCLQVGAHADRGALDVMEDEHAVHMEQELAMVGVFDGHCGNEVATYLHDTLLPTITTHLGKNRALCCLYHSRSGPA